MSFFASAATVPATTSVSKPTSIIAPTTAAAAAAVAARALTFPSSPYCAGGEALLLDDDDDVNEDDGGDDDDGDRDYRSDYDEDCIEGERYSFDVDSEFCPMVGICGHSFTRRSLQHWFQGRQTDIHTYRKTKLPCPLKCCITKKNRVTGKIQSVPMDSFNPEALVPNYALCDALQTIHHVKKEMLATRRNDGNRKRDTPCFSLTSHTQRRRPPPQPQQQQLRTTRAEAAAAAVLAATASNDDDFTKCPRCQNTYSTIRRGSSDTATTMASRKQQCKSSKSPLLSVIPIVGVCGHTWCLNCIYTFHATECQQRNCSNLKLFSCPSCQTPKAFHSEKLYENIAFRDALRYWKAMLRGDIDLLASNNNNNNNSNNNPRTAIPPASPFDDNHQRQQRYYSDFLHSIRIIKQKDPCSVWKLLLRKFPPPTDDAKTMIIKVEDAFSAETLDTTKRKPPSMVAVKVEEVIEIVNEDNSNNNNNSDHDQDSKQDWETDQDDEVAKVVFYQRHPVVVADLKAKEAEDEEISKMAEKDDDTDRGNRNDNESNRLQPSAKGDDKQQQVLYSSINARSSSSHGPTSGRDLIQKRKDATTGISPEEVVIDLTSSDTEGDGGIDNSNSEKNHGEERVDQSGAAAAAAAAEEEEEEEDYRDFAHHSLHDQPELSMLAQEEEETSYKDNDDDESTTASSSFPKATTQELVLPHVHYLLLQKSFQDTRSKRAASTGPPAAAGTKTKRSNGRKKNHNNKKKGKKSSKAANASSTTAASTLQCWQGKRLLQDPSLPTHNNSNRKKSFKKKHNSRKRKGTPSSNSYYGPTVDNSGGDGDGAKKQKKRRKSSNNGSNHNSNNNSGAKRCSGKSVGHGQQHGTKSRQKRRKLE